MLHLRVISPTESSDSVLQVLRREVGVTHIVVHRDAALDPRGDEITADIARECANDVIDELKALGLKRRGAITLDVVDTVVSTAAYRAEKEADGDPADAVIWDELAERTREESTLNATYLTFLTLACLIAAVGVVTDSPVTVVGAMVVGPEFGPLAALAVAFVRRRGYLAGGRRWRWSSVSRWRCWSRRSACSAVRPWAGSSWATPDSSNRWTSSFRSVRCRSWSHCSPAQPGCYRWCPRNPPRWSGCSFR
ncbi:hypothetical protein I546_3338 [Mycobacterium kansasii 732]|nr:hypothetical protein I546_3338 [Mycobacterium kansasii 732]